MTSTGKNKNCHFCEHAPKRCISLSCTSCDQVFCEKCCVRHLKDKPQAEAGSPWSCAICRIQCCCVKKVCQKQHLHCKRYRRRVKHEQQKSIKAEASTSESKGSSIDSIIHREEPTVQPSLVPHPEGFIGASAFTPIHTGSWIIAGAEPIQTDISMIAGLTHLNMLSEHLMLNAESLGLKTLGGPTINVNI
eukprot:751363-Hanusia_phi.AAC.1